MTLSALQFDQLIADSDDVRISLPKGDHVITKSIDLPNSKRILIEGEPGAKVVFKSTIPGDSCFKLTNDNDSWEGSLVVRGIEIDAKSAANQSCFGCAAGPKINHNQIIIEDVRMRSTGYNIRFDNMDYSIAPTFRNLRGGNGIYWAGSPHTASGLLIEECRFHNGRRGPQIYISGARKWTLRNNITEGSEAWHDDINHDAPDVMQTRGVLINNPGPNGGTIDSHWGEYWDKVSCKFDVTINYGFNNGGANKPSCFSLVNTELKKLQIVNTSTTDSLDVYAHCPCLDLPNFSDEGQFRISGFSRLYVNGGKLNRDYRFDNPRVVIQSATIIKPASEPASYSDGVSPLYAFTGGTGVYASGATKGDWSKCRPYVQHHPKHGHSLVFKATEKLAGTAFVAPMPKSLSSGELSQEFWACCPHLVASVGGNGFGAGMIGSMGNRFAFEPGHAPKRFVGGGDDRESVGMFRVASANSNSGKWLQIFTSAAWRGGFGDSPAIADNYDCYEWPNEPGPPLGTSIVGDVCRSAASAWQCTESGTSRPIQVTGNAVKGVAAITGLSDITELLVGDFLDIAGATGVYRILDIVGDVVTLDKKITSSANLTAAIVTNHAPTWTAKP